MGKPFSSKRVSPRKFHLMLVTAVGVAGCAVVGAGTLTGDHKLKLAEDFGGECVKCVLCFHVCNVYGMVYDLFVESIDAVLDRGAYFVGELVTLGVCVCEKILLCVVFSDESVEFFGMFVVFDGVFDCCAACIGLYECAELCDEFKHFFGESGFHNSNFLSVVYDRFIIDLIFQYQTSSPVRQKVSLPVIFTLPEREIVA